MRAGVLDHLGDGILAGEQMDEPDATFLSWGLVGLLGAVAAGHITADAGYAVVQLSLRRSA